MSFAANYPFYTDAATTQALLAESRSRIEARRSARFDANRAAARFNDRRAMTRIAGSEVWTMEERLAEAARQQAARRFTGAAMTGFGLFESLE